MVVLLVVLHELLAFAHGELTTVRIGVGMEVSTGIRTGVGVGGIGVGEVAGVNVPGVGLGVGVGVGLTAWIDTIPKSQTTSTLTIVNGCDSSVVLTYPEGITCFTR